MTPVINDDWLVARMVPHHGPSRPSLWPHRHMDEPMTASCEPSTITLPAALQLLSLPVPTHGEGTKLLFVCTYARSSLGKVASATVPIVVQVKPLTVVPTEPLLQ